MPVPWCHRPPDQTQKPICIDDDDEWLVDSLKVLLKAFGFPVQSYSSGGELLADDQRQRAACLVIDHHMPDMNGLDIVDHLQKEGLRVPTILISGRLDTNARDRASNLGVASVIERPFAADRLIHLIGTALLEHS